MENTEREFEDLTPAEKQLRGLIFAVEDKDNNYPRHSTPLGEAYLKHVLGECKEFAKENNIPLVKID